MKRILTFLALFIPVLSFCQISELESNVNDAIGPNYIVDLDTLPTYHKFNLIAKTTLKPDGLKRTIVVASNGDSTAELNKIFILREKDGDFVIEDTSASFDAGDLGPYVEIKGNYLFVIHNFDQGFMRLTYFYNAGLGKYRLSKLYYNNIQDNYPDNDHSFNLTEEYDIQDQSLTLKSIFRNYSDGSIAKQKAMVISKKLPDGIRLGLGKMKDPYDYDVFLTEGNVYKQIAKY